MNRNDKTCLNLTISLCKNNYNIFKLFKKKYTKRYLNENKTVSTKSSKEIDTIFQTVGKELFSNFENENFANGKWE